MKRANFLVQCSLPIAVLLALPLIGCGASGGSGGAGGAALPCGQGGPCPCAQDGSCPAGMVCGGTYCKAIGDATASDATAADDTASASDATASSSGATTDTATSSGGTDTGNASSSGGTDTGNTSSSGGADTATSSGGTDTGNTSSSGGTDVSNPSTLAIATVQQGTASKVCANTGGPTTVLEKAKLEDAVVTMDPLSIGKNWLFFVRPVGAPAVGGQWQGIKVFVFGSAPAVKAGDTVRLTGDVIEYFCETEISLAGDTIVKVGSGTAPAPYAVAPAAVAYKDTTTEAYEGVLVTLQNVKIANANTLGSDGKTHGGFSVVAQGGSPEVRLDLAAASQFTKNDDNTGSLITTFTAGQVFASVTGHVNYSFGEFIVIPRTDADLVTQ